MPLPRGAFSEHDDMYLRSVLPVGFEIHTDSAICHFLKQGVDHVELRAIEFCCTVDFVTKSRMCELLML